MTTFEDMQKAWQEQSAKLEAATRLSTNLIAQTRVERIRTPVRRLIDSLRLEAGFSFVGMLVLGSFLAAHWHQARFVWPAALLDLWFWATLVTSIRQLAAAAAVDYYGPVARVQEELTALRMMRLRAFRWIFLSGQIVWWVPFSITALRMFFGVDAYRYVSTTFLAVNLLAGLIVTPVALVAAKRVDVEGSHSWVGRLTDIIAGHSLSEAQRQAQNLADFR